MQIEGESLSRTQQKKLRKLGLVECDAKVAPKTGLVLKDFKPKTINQSRIYREYNQGKNLFIHGYAGTGKSFVALYLALKQYEIEKSHKQIIIIRSAVSGRNQGFLPGSEKQKAEVFEAPYAKICSELYGRDDAYSVLKQKKIVTFETTSYLRGQTFRDAIVIVDECQNMSFQEMSTVVTRMGENSRIVICGDIRQSDFRWDDEKSDVRMVFRVLNDIETFANIEMRIEDIVRSGLAREFILAAIKHKAM